MANETYFIGLGNPYGFAGCALIAKEAISKLFFTSSEANSSDMGSFSIAHFTIYILF